MTTVIGLAHPETNIAILAADRQATITGENQQIIGKDLGSRKIWKSENNKFAFGHSGRYDKRTDKLVSQMIKGKIDLQKVVQEKRFPELRDFNYSQMGDRVPELDKLSSFLLITRFNKKPKLYTCWPLGLVEERELTYIGSGSDKVQKYFEALHTIFQAREYLGSKGKTTNDDVLRVSLEALKYAQERDIYSSGLDLIVLSSKRITDHANNLEDNFEKRIKKIQREHKQLE